MSDAKSMVEPGPRTSLRRRWNRAFATLTLVVLVAGTAGLIGTRLLIDAFSDAAFKVESDSTVAAQLRADIVAYVGVTTNADWDVESDGVAVLGESIDAGYIALADGESDPAVLAALRASQAEWDAIVAVTTVPDLATRGGVVLTRIPAVLAQIDEAAAAGQAAVRAQLDDAADREHVAMVALAATELLAVLLAVRMARQLSHEVLRPLRQLRDSVNRLAAGELDHRIAIDRTDEIGDLAGSFNVMADAIAGNQQALTLEATTDSLSGLANRAAFRTRLDATLAQAERRGEGQAVLFVDLDDFKDVNDAMGHAAGDEVLRVVGERLRTVTRPGDLVARLGGDEFAILLDGLTDHDLGLTIATRVVAALAEPVLIDGRAASVGASVGVALRRVDSTVDELMREADVAMYAAKAKGKDRVEMYNAASDHIAVTRHQLRVDVIGAAARDELVVDYQPIVDLDTGAVAGLEALVRWQHPTLGLLMPAMFIDLAEETGAIVDIGAWVLDQAAHQLRQWQDRHGLPELFMSVNVSVRQLDRAAFADEVLTVMRNTGIDPRRLVLEVTESILADPAGGASIALAALRTPGVRIALDDFGTGHSSLGYLRQFPVDIVKIDRSFVSGAFVGAGRADVLGAVVGMAQRLDLEVIAEGIEELGQLQAMRALGCRFCQGFLLSRPVRPDAIDPLLAASTRTALPTQPPTPALA